MRPSVVVALLAAALVLPAAALAKGPDYALVSGPGIDGSVRIDGDGESGRVDTPLGALTTYGGYGTQVFGHHPRQPTTKLRPGGVLGPRYRVEYSVPTPTGRRTIVADLYPYATPRPVTHMEPGQPFFPGMTTHGGWYVAPAALTQTIARAAASAPRSGGTPARVWVALAGAALATLAAVSVFLSRRRFRPRPAPAR